MTRLHWVVITDLKVHGKPRRPICVAWSGRGWKRFGRSHVMPPDEAARLGWSYLKPVELPELPEWAR